jgi:hypothetical protein
VSSVIRISLPNIQKSAVSPNPTLSNHETAIQLPSAPQHMDNRKPSSEQHAFRISLPTIQKPPVSPNKTLLTHETTIQQSSSQKPSNELYPISESDILLTTAKALSVGDWVAVAYDQLHTWFLGQVMQTKPFSKVKINYMEETASNVFHWPRDKDQDCVLADSILTKTSTPEAMPTTSSGRQKLKYSLPWGEYSRVSALFNLKP